MKKALGKDFMAIENGQRSLELSKFPKHYERYKKLIDGVPQKLTCVGYGVPEQIAG